jgi:hypothetical protein
MPGAHPQSLYVMTIKQALQMLPISETEMNNETLPLVPANV